MRNLFVEHILVRMKSTKFKSSFSLGLITCFALLGILPVAYSDSIKQSNPGPKELIARFEDLCGLTPQSKVVIRGLACGSVVKITNTDDGENLATLEISANCQSLIKRGTVALISSLEIESGQSIEGKTVELLVPSRRRAKLLSSGSEIPGYTSFSKMWSANERDGQS